MGTFSAICHQCGLSFKRVLSKKTKNGIYFCNTICYKKHRNPGNLVNYAGHTGLTTAQYNALHGWIKRHFGKATKCESQNCKFKNPTRFEWALKKGFAYERNIENFMQLCKSCHKKYDYTELTKEKIRKRMTGVPSKRRVPVYLINIKNGERFDFESVAAASNYTGLLRTSIANCLSGLSKQSGDYKCYYK